MHNRALHDTLAAFVDEAARQLAEEVSGGAEVPFELVESGRAGAPLYCYRPLTGRFIAERVGSLGRLESYPAARRGLEALPGLAEYLDARGRRVPARDGRALADAALQAFLTAVWLDATDFAFDGPRFEEAYAELERTAYGGWTLSTVLAPVDGLVCESDEVALGDGLSLVRARTLDDAPVDLDTHDAYAMVALLRLEAPGADGASLDGAGRRLRRLQTALRLWDDAEPSLGPTAWTRSGDGRWLPVPLATGLRRVTENCLLAAEEEDPLRAFCALVARRTPRGGELAWALRRFELGCERGSALEALTDWLLAARAVLSDGDDGRVVARLAALCAVPADREPLAARLRETFALERGVIAGTVRADAAVEDLVEELGRLERAVLRDVLCGHLEPDLRRTADALLTEVGAAA
jgi:hypothetical protein